jgi:hypothetical protein
MRRLDFGGDSDRLLRNPVLAPGGLDFFSAKEKGKKRWLAERSKSLLPALFQR